MASTYNVQIEDSEGNKYCPKPDLLTTQEQVNANTASGKSVDALAVKGLINNLTTSFQAGVNTLYNACVSCGVTPSAKTPAAISAAISTISTNRYNAGRTQGQNDVKGSPNNYGLYTAAQYTANYNSGYSAGIANGDVKHSVYAKAYYETSSNGSINDYVAIFIDNVQMERVKFGSAVIDVRTTSVYSV